MAFNLTLNLRKQSRELNMCLTGSEEYLCMDLLNQSNDDKGLDRCEK